MREPVIATGHSLVRDSLAFDEPGNAFFAATISGGLIAVGVRYAMIFVAVISNSGLRNLLCRVRSWRFSSTRFDSH